MYNECSEKLQTLILVQNDLQQGCGLAIACWAACVVHIVYNIPQNEYLNTRICPNFNNMDGPSVISRIM